MTAGLSDGTQAILTLIADVSISVGAITAATAIVVGDQPYLGLGLIILGAVGRGIKEALGAKTTQPATV